MTVSENPFSKSNTNQESNHFFELLENSNSEGALQAFEQKVFRAGETIFEEGSIATGAYLVLEGSACGQKTTVTNQHLSAKLRSKGEVFGFVPFLEGKNTNNMTFVASTNLKVLFIPANNFTVLVQNSPAIRQFLLGIFYREIHHLKTTLRYKISFN